MREREREREGHLSTRQKTSRPLKKKGQTYQLAIWGIMFLATPDDDEDDQQFNTQFGHFLYNPIIIIIIIMLSNLGISCNPDT
jgi:hypothetical protein